MANKVGGSMDKDTLDRPQDHFPSNYWDGVDRGDHDFDLDPRYIAWCEWMDKRMATKGLDGL